MYGLGIIWRLAILLVATVGPPGLTADGNVGCLFSETLCVDQEWCYDDHAFGRCLPGFGSVVDEDLFQYELDRANLHNFEREMRRLFALGYRWGHDYTQCILQALLYSARQDEDYDNAVCSHLSDQDLEGALLSLESEDSDPEATAFVRYTPSANNPNTDFADEIYFPSNVPMEIGPDVLEDRIEQEPIIGTVYNNLVKKTWIPAMHRRSPRYTMDMSQNNYYTDEFNSDDLNKYMPFIDYIGALKLTPDDLEYLLQPENSEDLQRLINDFFEIYEREREEKQKQEMMLNWIRGENLEFVKEQILNELSQREVGPTKFFKKYNTPEKFRNGWELKDVIPVPLSKSDLFESRVYIDDLPEEDHPEETGSGETVQPPEIFRELERQNTNIDNSQPPIFTEGGMVLPQFNGEVNKDPEIILKDDLGKFLDEFDWGFKRRERLDVKKPGPPFNEHILGTTEAGLSNTVPKKIKDDDILPALVKKDPRGGTHPDPLHDQISFDVDTDYVYISLKESVTTWREGNEIVWNISNILGLDPKTFSHTRVGRNEVTFRVEPNKLGLNATDIANKIDTIKDRLKNEQNVEITAAGVGDMVKMPAVTKVASPYPMSFMYMVYVWMALGGLIIAMILIALIPFIRNEIKSRKKLNNLHEVEGEASKDYSDLCRARMATKGQQPAEKPDTVHGRITSLSRESEGSPSSRSSTSSWSEEPSLTNMDISTGHMVLTYMEDHLKNKDRLEQEWVALCAYEAEPCSTTVALRPENVKKNRYMEILPYDHARVVLNELANASNTDYINASSITDHDPRNPAYIATQGPLPHTAPDFWQMVWEQGSVVMVMLTRLTENGNAMCHRYWPEEGSEVYHIYEVHLVSEHIWCDDYLVRSFYLKNVKTGETRTVTQFHFLSWPDHGIPTSTKALLEFRRKVNKSYRGRSCPIVVHCSDGAGRTGTYTLIDMVLNRMAKGAKEIDIAATLEHIRDQRARMVATKQQFEFVLMAVAEEVHAILKQLPQQIEKQEKEKENK